MMDILREYLRGAILIALVVLSVLSSGAQQPACTAGGVEALFTDCKVRR